MAWYDNIPGVSELTTNGLPGNWNSLRDNPISNGLFGQGPKQAIQPGVGGPAADPSKLVRDPVTGMFYDPTTGTSYQDAAGQVVVTNPNVAQQVAVNAQRANAFLSQLGGLEAERKATQQRQQQLEGHFNDVLSGNAPSLAEMQARGLAQAGGAQQLAQVAGANGASGPLASLMAARNTGQVYTNANNAGTMGRVAEEDNAAKALSALLGAEAQGTQAATNTTGALGTHFADTSAAGQAGQQGLDSTANLKKAEDEKAFGGGILSTVAHIMNPVSTTNPGGF